MQDTYVNAFKNLTQFEQLSNFKTWLIRIRLNSCYRKKQKFSFKNEHPPDIINEKVTPMFSHSINDAIKQIHARELGHLIEE